MLQSIAIYVTRNICVFLSYANTNQVINKAKYDVYNTYNTTRYVTFYNLLCSHIFQVK